MDKARLREREVIDKNQIITELWNFFNESEPVDCMYKIPQDKLKSLKTTPYDVLVYLLANHRRVNQGWSWRRIRDKYKITAYFSQKICGLRKTKKL